MLKFYSLSSFQLLLRSHTPHEKSDHLRIKPTSAFSLDLTRIRSIKMNINQCDNAPSTPIPNSSYNAIARTPPAPRPVRVTTGVDFGEKKIRPHLLLPNFDSGECGGVDSLMFTPCQLPRQKLHSYGNCFMQYGAPLIPML